MSERVKLQTADSADVVFGERAVEYRLVDTVEKFRAEAAAEQRGDLALCVFAYRSVGRDAVENDVGAEVRGHNDDRVPEVHGASLTVGYPAVVKHLKQQVEDVGMSLLDLIEEDDRVGLATDCLGELTALVVADISGRRSDKP